MMDTINLKNRIEKTQTDDNAEVKTTLIMGEVDNGYIVIKRVCSISQDEDEYREPTEKIMVYKENPLKKEEEEEKVEFDGIQNMLENIK